MAALEVALLDRSRERRAFRRITGAVLRDMLPATNRGVDEDDPAVAGGDDAPAAGGAVNGPDGAANGTPPPNGG